MEGHFFQQLIEEPTQITCETSTILDHLWVNTSELVAKYQTLPGLSDHRMILAECDLKIAKTKGSTFTCRSYRGFNKERYNRDIANVDWSFLELNNIEDIWAKWKGVMNEIISDHTQTITYTQGNKTKIKPWLNQDVREMIRMTQIATIKKDYFPTKTNKENLKKIKKVKDIAVLRAKQTYYHGKIEENTVNPRKLWKIMKELVPDTKRSNMDMKRD